MSFFFSTRDVFSSHSEWGYCFLMFTFILCVNCMSGCQLVSDCYIKCVERFFACMFKSIIVLDVLIGM